MTLDGREAPIIQTVRNEGTHQPTQQPSRGNGELVRDGKAWGGGLIGSLTASATPTSAAALVTLHALVIR